MKRITLHKIVLLIVSLLYVYYISKKIDISSKVVDDSASGSNMLLGLTMVFLIAMGGIYVFQNITKQTNTRLSTFFFLWMIGGIINIWLIPMSMIQNIKIMNSLFFMMPYFLFSYFHWILEKRRNIEPFLNKIVVIMSIGVFLFQLKSYTVIYAFFGDIRIGATYFSLFMLPFVLYIPSKFWRIFLMAVLAIITILSLKRGGVVALTIALFAYYWANSYCKNKSNNIIRNSFFAVIVLSALIGGVIVLDNSINNGQLVQRMESINNDQGSGRVDVYEAVWSRIEKSSMSEILFGHGFEATKDVVSLGKVQLTAHNDLLEVFYDFGIIMFILYLAFWIILFKYMMKHVRKRTNLAAPLAAVFALFAVLSFISHIMIYPHIVTIAMFLGLVTGKSQIVEKRIKAKIK